VQGQQIHLLELPNPDPVEGRPSHGGRDRHIAFSIVSVAELKSRLQQNQVEFTESRSGRAAIFCRDPDGNALEFIEQSA
jgi:glyoxylase I family protein